MVAGGVPGCRGACVVAVGHAWLPGACVVPGGMCGCRGVSVVARGVAKGGMYGEGGACVGYEEIQRYDQ